MAVKTCLLNLPSELRNSIYVHVFTTSNELPAYSGSPEALTLALKLQYADDIRQYEQLAKRHQLRVLQTCRQIHDEAYLLATSLTAFDVVGKGAEPECFAAITAHIRESKLAAMRHFTLTARIPQLRALNERWHGLPFGHSSLDLDTLTIIPTKPDVTMTTYREIADMSQSHALAYVFAETLKTLRRVRVVHVRNRGCFNEVVWRLVYRSLVYRIWRWGGQSCGIRFLCCGDDEEHGAEWFKVWLNDAEGSDQARDVGEEVVRLVGGGDTMPPVIPGF